MRKRLSIKVTQKGDFKNLDSYLNRSLEKIEMGVLDKYGRQGVTALALATPVDTHFTANAWYYEIRRNDAKHEVKIVYNNRNVVDGVNIAIILQYGHATNNGGYVVGRDYINPALRDTFDKIAESSWREITKV